MQDSLEPQKKASPSGAKSRDPLVGSTLDGRYYIEEILGTGGMSVVYKATQLTIDRHVAIKTIKLQVDSKPIYRERFVREIRSLCALSHPNVVTVYDCVIGDDDQPYVVMDYLRGKSLDALIKDDGPLELERFARICVQVCSALDHAHKKGIVHRDIKPGNIVLMDEEMDFVKVVDFGLAKLGDDGRKLTNSGELWGSPPYISPEQCMGKTGDARSDIYSFGTVMFEMLTGKDPFFDALSVFELIQKHVGSSPPPFVDVNHTLVIPGKVQDVVFKAMEKDPERRYQNALALQAAIIEACSSDIGRESREYLVHMAKQASTRPPGTGQKSGEIPMVQDSGNEGGGPGGDQASYFNNALSDISQSDMMYFAENTPKSNAAPTNSSAVPNETTKWSREGADSFVPTFEESDKSISKSVLDSIPTPAPKAVPGPTPVPDSVSSPPSAPAPLQSPASNPAPGPAPAPVRANLSRQSLDAPGGNFNSYVIVGVLVLAVIGFLIFQQVSSKQKTADTPSSTTQSSSPADTSTSSGSDTQAKPDSSPAITKSTSKPQVQPKPVVRAPVRTPRRSENPRASAPRPTPAPKPARGGGKQDPWSALEKMRD